MYKISNLRKTLGVEFVLFFLFVSFMKSGGPENFFLTLTRSGSEILNVIMIPP